MASLPRSAIAGSFVAAVSVGAFAGCRAPAPAVVEAPVAAPMARPASSSSFDPCKDSKPVPHPYQGILRNARCEQDMYLTMAGVAGELGGECTLCHVPLVVNGQPVPKKEDYPVMTDRKAIANWMSTDLMTSIKPADGSKMTCKSCHTGDDGKPLVKILGQPRDVSKAMEWMNVVMVNRFVTLDGEKLKCKHCHQANVGSPGFIRKIILTDHLPSHAPHPASKP